MPSDLAGLDLPAGSPLHGLPSQLHSISSAALATPDGGSLWDGQSENAGMCNTVQGCAVQGQCAEWVAACVPIVVQARTALPLFDYQAELGQHLRISHSECELSQSRRFSSECRSC